jgi:hypothetical protein
MLESLKEKAAKARETGVFGVPVPTSFKKDFPIST